MVSESCRPVGLAAALPRNCSLVSDLPGHTKSMERDGRDGRRRDQTGEGCGRHLNPSRRSLHNKMCKRLLEQWHLDCKQG